MKTVCLFLLLPIAATAQINYTGGTYTQDFDSLQDDKIYTPYTNLPAGWIVSRGSYVWTNGTNGYSGNYGTFCFASSAGTTDKALGLVIGSTGAASFGAHFRNLTGATLDFFTLGYYVEQWVRGSVTNQDQSIPFQYSLDATSLSSGTYTSVSALAMHSIQDGNGTPAALDGNAPANRQFVTAIVPLVWSPNQDLWIRWVGVANSFTQSHALAVDDLSFSALPTLTTQMIPGAQLIFSWPTNAINYHLQSADSLSSSNWNNVTNLPMMTNNQFSVSIPTTQTASFFRLSK